MALPYENSSAGDEVMGSAKAGTLRPFRVLAAGIESIVWARNAGAARYAVWRAANEVGYQVGFPEISVRRAFDFDSARSDRVLPGAPYDPRALQ